MMTFGETVRQAKTSHKITLRKFAAMIELPPVKLSKIERGEKYCNGNEIEKIKTEQYKKLAYEQILLKKKAGLLPRGRFF